MVRFDGSTLTSRAQAPSQRRRATRSAEQRPTAHCVLAAFWCCSVGTSWTVELRSIHDAASAGPAVEWISSGVPTQHPAPELQTADLLAERGFWLFPVNQDDLVESVPRARSRRLIGYVTRDPEVMRLARLLADTVDEDAPHPMMLAGRWVQAGYSADAAASWVAAGVTIPEAARTLLST